MSVPAAYAAVVLIWATTPLGIKWSADSVSFIAAVASRMIMGAVLAVLLLKLLRQPFPWRAGVWKSYAAGALGLYCAMVLAYWAALSLPTGLISVLFGLAPIISGAFGRWLLGERELTPLRVVALLVAIVGLGLIFHGELTLGSSGLAGIMALLASVTLYSLSGVLVKRENAPVLPLAQTAGALTIAAPAYFVSWLLIDGQVPAQVSLKSAVAISYLTVFGSVLGFWMFFYLLQKLPAGRTALITLMTPVLALALGYYFENEVLSDTTVVGVVMILLSLLVYLFGAPLKAMLVRKLLPDV